MNINNQEFKSSTTSKVAWVARKRILGAEIIYDIDSV